MRELPGGDAALECRQQASETCVEQRRANELLVVVAVAGGGRGGFSDSRQVARKPGGYGPGQSRLN